MTAPLGRTSGTVPPGDVGLARSPRGQPQRPRELSGFGWPAGSMSGQSCEGTAHDTMLAEISY
jgi:hypothetical protein